VLDGVVPGQLLDIVSSMLSSLELLLLSAAVVLDESIGVEGLLGEDAAHGDETLLGDVGNIGFASGGVIKSALLLCAGFTVLGDISKIGFAHGGVINSPLSRCAGFNDGGWHLFDRIAA